MKAGAFYVRLWLVQRNKPLDLGDIVAGGAKKRSLWLTPHRARLYLLLSAFFLALPSLSTLYKGYEGKFLVSSVRTNGTFFEKTVIYIERHDLFQAHGYVVNMPVSSKALSAGVYVGGPVEQELVSVLYEDTEASSGFRITLIDTLYGDDIADLLRRLREREGAYPVRVYAGYSGWTLLQLNYEVLRGGWHILDYDPALMFDTPPSEMWEKARQSLSLKDSARIIPAI